MFWNNGPCSKSSLLARKHRLGGPNPSRLVADVLFTRCEEVPIEIESPSSRTWSEVPLRCEFMHPDLIMEGSILRDFFRWNVHPLQFSPLFESTSRRSLTPKVD
ncbi:hypothetical protein CDAR_182251 [Caerostris darwini]|uniref:Uncharacterized protein n=1 Tax=Caerostris darwini TaxID=1538125 RepID=A0AAV4U5A4_9ARAC|nr:hypothetical protein CDAR_182251 [Caerostris darwini]